jgi:hypothetical protein
MEALPDEIWAIIFTEARDNWEALSLVSKKVRGITLQYAMPVERIVPLLLVEDWEGAKLLLSYRKPQNLDMEFIFACAYPAVEVLRRHGIKEYLSDQKFQEMALERGRIDLLTEITTVDYLKLYPRISTRDKINILPRVKYAPIKLPPSFGRSFGRSFPSLGKSSSESSKITIFRSPTSPESRVWERSIYDGDNGFHIIDALGERQWLIYCECFLDDTDREKTSEDITSMLTIALNLSTSPGRIVDKLTPFLDLIEEEDCRKFHAHFYWSVLPVVCHPRIGSHFMDGDMEHGGPDHPDNLMFLIAERVYPKYIIRMLEDPQEYKVDDKDVLSDLTEEDIAYLASIPEVGKSDKALKKICTGLVSEQKYDLLGKFLSLVGKK